MLRAAWIPGHPEDEAAYLLMPEKALLDRSISRTEGRQLVQTAESARLTTATADRLHRKYLRACGREAADPDSVSGKAAKARAYGIPGQRRRPTRKQSLSDMKYAMFI